MQKKYLTSFGRIKARKLAQEQEIALPEIMAKYTFKEIETGYKQVILEIGFGMGEHILHRAQNDPQSLYIGCEPFVNGVAKLCKDIKNSGVTNIRIHNGDARLLIESFPDACLDKIYLLHPDPWPKARHNKRRIVNEQTLDMFARILKANGQMQVATDWQDYAKWILRHFLDCPHFAWTAQSKTDWENEPEGHIQTKYQKKSLKEGRKAVFMLFAKNS
jgi:tRNA (guanine-N7-)-methyltransferase